MGIRAFSASVAGRVQGVGFRWAAAVEAQRLGLKGWVRNMSSGEVEVWVEGQEEKVHAFLEWLHRGPSYAHVSEVLVTHVSPKGYKQFTIDYERMM
jgi:acylphosphatase